MSRTPDPHEPPWVVLALVCAALLALPLCSIAGLGEIGGYRMFSRVRPVQLRIVAVEADGAVAPVGPDALELHLGPDARRILLPGLRTRALGDTAEGATRAALPELAALVCGLREGRRRVDVELVIEHRDRPAERVTEGRPCP